MYHEIDFTNNENVFSEFENDFKQHEIDFHDDKCGTAPSPGDRYAKGDL